jgi:hypothetical protein
MRGRIESLERQLERANERDRENRRIIAALTSRMPAIVAPEFPETATEQPGRVERRRRSQASRRPQSVLVAQAIRRRLRTWQMRQNRG